MAYSPQDVYARHLISGRGYPLWTPESDASLPEIYAKEGLKIGDVGVVVPENGSFDVFFNVCLPEDHILHRQTGVPHDFSPILLGERDICKFPEAEDAGSIISTSSVTWTASTEPSGEDPTRAQPSPLNYRFSLSSGEGAILILPEGAEYYRLRNERLFRDVAIRHAVNWYTFAEDRLGCIISHDSLYLITGFHKARSWSLAAYQHDQGARKASAQFKAVHVGRGNIAASYTWETRQAMDRRVGPSDRFYNFGVPNQTMFIRGFKIAIRPGLLGLGGNKVDVKTGSPSVRFGGAEPGLFNRWPFSIPRGTSGGTGSSTSANTPNRTVTALSAGESNLGAQEGDSDISEDVMIQRFPEVTKPFHPSDVINRDLLQKDPSATVAVTHDSVWATILEKGLLIPEDLLQEDRLIAGVASCHTLVTHEGAVCWDSPDDGAPSVATSTISDGQQGSVDSSRKITPGSSVVKSPTYRPKASTNVFKFAQPNAANPAVQVFPREKGRLVDPQVKKTKFKHTQAQEDAGRARQAAEKAMNEARELVEQIKIKQQAEKHERQERVAALDTKVTQTEEATAAAKRENPIFEHIQAREDAERARQEAEKVANEARELAEQIKIKQQAEEERERAHVCQEQVDVVSAQAAEEAQWMKAQMEEATTAAKCENPTFQYIHTRRDAEYARQEAEKAANEARELAEQIKQQVEEVRERARKCQEQADLAAAQAAEDTQWMKAQIEEAAAAAKRAEELAKEASMGAKEEADRLAQEAQVEREHSQKKREDVERAMAEMKEETDRVQKAADEQRRLAEEGNVLAEEMARTAAEETKRAKEVKEDAERRLKEGIQPVVTPTPEEVAAAKRRVQYRENCFHFAVAGVSGSGKSSLVNAFRGLRAKDVGAAAVGVFETTLQMMRYPDANPGSPFAWYDVPGAGTIKYRDWQYFNNQGLYVFDCIIVLYDNRFTMTDIAILTNARRFKIPTYIVRSKADQHIWNLMDELGNDSDAEDLETLYNMARKQFIEKTRKSVKTNLEDLRLPDQRVYIISNKTLSSVVHNKMPKKMIDEAELFHDLMNEAQRGRKATGAVRLNETVEVAVK